MRIVKCTIRFTDGCVLESTYTEREVSYIGNMTNRVIFDWAYQRTMRVSKLYDCDIDDLSIELIAD